MAFVLLSFPRSGTHMLRSALNNHPEIICHNEIFNTDITPADTIIAKGAEQLYLEHTGDHEGFTVHGYTPNEDFPTATLTQPLWAVLQEKQPTIIALERHDLLRRCFSEYQAIRTQQWHASRSQNDVRKQALLTIPASAVAWTLNSAIAAREQRCRLFPDAHVVMYEELVTYWHKPVAVIQKLIGVKPMELQPTTRKLDKRPITQVVSNYRELKEHFAATQYARWFKLAEAMDAAQVHLLEAP